MNYESKFRLEFAIWILCFPFVILIFACGIKSLFAQSGSIVPKQDTISPQVSHSSPYSYFPIYSFDTTKEGVIMRKVAECKNGVLKVFDSAKAETIIRNEYQKIRK